MVTDRDLQILLALLRYFFLNVMQIAEVLGVDKNIIRGRVRVLREMGLVRCPDTKIVSKEDPDTAAPVHTITIAGSCVVARRTNNAGLILPCEPSFQDWCATNHKRRVSGVHIKLDQAVACQSGFTLTDLKFEHTVVDPKAKDPAQKFFLYQRFGDVKCIPDSAFVLREKEGANKPRAYFLEYECGTEGPKDMWNFKQKGYVMMHAVRRHQTLFPGTSAEPRVICVCPYLDWLKALRDAMKTDTGDLMPGAKLWLLIDIKDLNAAKGSALLFKPLFWKANGDHPVSLLSAPESPHQAEGEPEDLNAEVAEGVDHA